MHTGIRKLCQSRTHQVPRDDIQSRLDLVKTGALRAGLEGGVAFLHDTMAPEDRKIAEDLFAVGAVQVPQYTQVIMHT